MTRRGLNTRSNSRWCPSNSSRLFWLMFMIAVSAVSGWAQTRLSPEFHLRYTDMSVLASRERRADFSCHVTTDRPALGFDLRFHSDYRVTVPIKVLADVGGRLQTVIRVTPSANSEEPVYLVHQYSVPALQSGEKWEGALAGGFDLGPGRYQVDWMMRDGRGRVCSLHWELDAKLSGSEQRLPLTIDPNKVAERLKGAFDEEPPTERSATRPLQVKFLLNLSPGQPDESILSSEDAAALLSILRSITRVPGIRCFALVAFNLREQKILNRQSNRDIDFVQLRQAVQSRTAGTINYHLLQDRQSETHFVTKLLTDQLGAAAASPDAIIIIGRKVTLDKKVPLERLKEGGAISCPIFYLNYNPKPMDNPWRDTLSSALKAYKGALEYEIVLPRDWGEAMRDMLSRIGKRAASEATTSPLLQATDGVIP
jgi:hypothetical protein